MKKLGKKELEIVVNEIGGRICEIKKEKWVNEFEGSEEGKRMRELEKGIKERLVSVNEDISELLKLEKEFISKNLEGSGYGYLDVKVDERVGWKKLGVDVRVGEGIYISSFGIGGDIKNKVERELILEGLKGEFDLDEVMKRMIEKFS